MNRTARLTTTVVAALLLTGMGGVAVANAATPPDSVPATVSTTVTPNGNEQYTFTNHTGMDLDVTYRIPAGTTYTHHLAKGDSWTVTADQTGTSHATITSGSREVFDGYQLFDGTSFRGWMNVYSEVMIHSTPTGELTLG